MILPRVPLFRRGGISLCQTEILYDVSAHLCDTPCHKNVLIVCSFLTCLQSKFYKFFQRSPESFTFVLVPHPDLGGKSNPRFFYRRKDGFNWGITVSNLKPFSSAS